MIKRSLFYCKEANTLSQINGLEVATLSHGKEARGQAVKQWLLGILVSTTLAPTWWTTKRTKYAKLNLVNFGRQIKERFERCKTHVL